MIDSIKRFKGVEKAHKNSWILCIILIHQMHMSVPWPCLKPNWLGAVNRYGSSVVKRILSITLDNELARAIGRYLLISLSLPVLSLMTGIRATDKRDCGKRPCTKKPVKHRARLYLLSLCELKKLFVTFLIIISVTGRLKQLIKFVINQLTNWFTIINW